ncbi:MAG: AraC family transcriptional regulator [Clostridia bacterium]|nr:AraC family transcriptional regulator [Clostridia bacterium]
MTELARKEINNFYFGIRENKKSTVSSEHYHDEYEIYYLEKGKCNYFIDEKCYEVEEGDVVIIPPRAIHGVVYLEENNFRRIMICPSSCLSETVLGALDNILYVYRNHNVRDRIIDILGRIETENSVRDEFFADIMLSLINEFFVLMLRNRQTRFDIITGDLYIEHAVKYIKRNYQNNIGLIEVAEFCHMSAEHLSRKFKKETGLGFSEYLNALRLQRAEVLLLSRTDLTVSEIAYNCGYNDPNYFSKKFKIRYGISPQAFRKGKKYDRAR